MRVVRDLSVCLVQTRCLLYASVSVKRVKVPVQTEVPPGDIRLCERSRDTPALKGLTSIFVRHSSPE